MPADSITSLLRLHYEEVIRTGDVDQVMGSRIVWHGGAA